MTQPNSLPSNQVGLTVNLAGIIQIFGNSLYNEFGAIVRELVQNGHDAVLEDYAAHGRSDKSLSDYWVNVRYDSIGRILILADNGIGMDSTDVSKDLTEFGRPKKTEVRTLVATATLDQPLYIIGLYGVGFLSAMAISEKVEVWTQQSGSEPVLWVYETGDEFATVTAAPSVEYEELRKRHGLRSNDPTGTIVICRLSAQVEEEYRITAEVVRDGLIRYVRLLRVPVFFNGERITDRSLAWENSSRATEDDWRGMIEDFTGSAPLLVIPIYSPPTDLDLEGVLWVPERSKILGDDGQIDVYVRRMFVTQDNQLIRPEWARFIMGMVNSNKLERIVSGNTIINDRHLDKVQEFVKSQILDAFYRLWELPEAEHWKVIGSYDDIIKISAAENEEFLNCIWEKLRVRTRDRRVTIPEYLAEVKRRTGRENTAYYYDKSVQEFSAGVVSDATRIPVLSLWSLNDDSFVKRVCRLRNIALLPFTELAASIIKKPADEELYQTLIAACAAQKIAADVREYEPAHMPAMLIEDQDLEERRRQLMEILRQGNVYDKRIAADIQDAFFRTGALNREVSFYLNAANPLIQALRSASFETQQAISMALYNISYMSIMPQLGRTEVQAIYNSICSVLMTLLEQSRPPQPPPVAEHCRPTRLFMITPYAEAYRGVEEAVRDVFEGPPYFFEVVLARDFMHESQLLEDIRAHIDAADGFIAEITDLNPNVMLELGAVLIKKDQSRPAFLLRATDAQPIPADLRAELYIPYGSPTDEPAKVAAAIRKLIEQNGKPTHRDVLSLLRSRTCKALSKRLLARIRCNNTEQDMLLQHYTTVEQLLEITSEAVWQTTGVSATVAEFVQKQLLEFVERSSTVDSYASEAQPIPSAARDEN